MLAYLSRAAQLRFIDGRPAMELQGWCVRVGYTKSEATPIRGAYNTTLENASKYLRKAINTNGYVEA